MKLFEVPTDLITKYNVPGPRYTSYPTAVQFKETKNTDELISALKVRNLVQRNISLYIHIPFCFSLCWYCGCTKIITRDRDRGDVYLDYLAKEMDLIAGMLHPESEVIQLHLGGGTPTFLSPPQLKKLGDELQKRFRFHKEIEFGVEIDPRSFTEQHAQVLAQIGCNRASLGVQDTNSDVQKAIHRIQPLEKTELSVTWLRQNGIKSINLDLIYGLPRQTVTTFSRTISDILPLNPDRLAVYSYAHIPSVMPSQKLLNADEFPSPGEKLSMLAYSIEALESQGYRYIGMDHFSKANDELSKALDNGTLQRNFQGYSTHSDTDMYALGMSGISMAGNFYFQNSKDIDSYYTGLKNGVLPVVKQLQLTRDDEIRRAWISKIMCKPVIYFDDFNEKWGIDAKSYFAEEWNLLIEPEQEGLLSVSDDAIIIHPTGRLFLRNIAMIFDSYLQSSHTDRPYSKTV